MVATAVNANASIDIAEELLGDADTKITVRPVEASYRDGFSQEPWTRTRTRTRYCDGTHVQNYLQFLSPGVEVGQ